MAINSKELKAEYQYFSEAFDAVSSYQKLEGLKQTISRASDKSFKDMQLFASAIDEVAKRLDWDRGNLVRVRKELLGDEYDSATTRVKKIRNIQKKPLLALIQQISIIVDTIEGIQIINKLNKEEVNYSGVEETINRLGELKHNIENYGLNVPSNENEEIKIKVAKMPAVFNEFRKHFEKVAENKPAELYQQKIKKSLANIKKMNK